MMIRHHIAIAGMAAGLLASSALADGVVRLEQGPYQAGSGGEFKWVRVAGDVGVTGTTESVTGDSFQSFCVEVQEHVSFGGVYNAKLGTYAEGGSFGGVNGRDELDARTAYLYTMFRSGQLQGYRYNGTQAERQADAVALQRAIWYIEEPGSSEGQMNQFVQLANAAGWTDIGDVRIMRLYVRNADGSDGGRAQDQLTLVPLPPAAWAGLGGLAMVMGGSYIRRRRNHAS